MELKVTQNLLELEQKYILTIPYVEWQKAKFNDMDRALFEECDKSSKLSDKLLGMELLVRRIEEANA